jgi:hypothetical protein
MPRASWVAQRFSAAHKIIFEPDFSPEQTEAPLIDRTSSAEPSGTQTPPFCTAQSTAP